MITYTLITNNLGSQAIKKNLADNSMSTFLLGVDDLFNSEYKEWLAAGNSPLPVDTSIITEAAISNAIQTMLDKQAQALRYDNIMSARSYAGYVNPFQAEALQLAKWSAACWVKAGEIELAVLNGATTPTIAEVLASLPEFKITINGSAASSTSGTAA